MQEVRRAGLMIGESMWAQRLVAQQLEFLEVIENVPDVIVIVRPDGHIRFANAHTARTLGLASAGMLVGLNLTELPVEEDRESCRGLLARRPVLLAGGGRTELRLVRAGREPAIIEVALLREIEFDDERSTLLVARDVTEERQLRLRLQVASQLASLGTLAAGVAHEINNPLTFVTAALGFVQEHLGVLVSQQDPELLGDVRQSLREALEGTHRIQHIVRDLKSFSRSEPVRVGRTDVHAAVEWALKVTAHQVSHRCHVRRELGPVPAVTVSETRLGQVLVNLLVNAAQALPEGRPAESCVRVATLTDERGRAVVEVEDNGCGIPPQLLARIFDPFFTTKPVGQGTGLGLAISHGIVVEAGGELQVRSRVGVGTCFRMVLPAAEAEPEAGEPSPAP